MSNLLNGSGGPAAPSYMHGVGDDDQFGQGMDGGGYPRLAFKTGRFRLRQGEDETVLKGTEIDILILRDYPAISRLYYADGYDPDGGSRPVCASADGEVPIPSAADPQSDKCSTCPMNEKGSAITDDNRKTRACSFYKRMVVLIRGYEDVGPVVTDMKAMSLFGESKPNDDQWSLKTYFRRLHSNNVKPFQVWTQISFDMAVSVPKILFRALEWVDESVFTDEIAPRIGTPDGRQLLEEMVDTSTVRTGDRDSDGGAMKDRLLSSDKPAHLEAPEEQAQEAEPELSPQQKAAITRKKNAEKKQAEEATAPAPAPAPEPEAKPEPTKASPADAELDKALEDFGF